MSSSKTPLDALLSVANHHPAPTANKCVTAHPARRSNNEPRFEIIASIVGITRSNNPDKINLIPRIDS